MKMYKVSLFINCKISEEEVTRVTEKSVWFEYVSKLSGKTETRRELKSTEYDEWFESYQEARNYVITRLKNKVSSFMKQAEKAQTELTKFEASSEVPE